MAPNIRVPANFGIEHINSEVHGNLVLKLKDGQQIKTNSMIMSLNSPVIDNLTTNMFQVFILICYLLKNKGSGTRIYSGSFINFSFRHLSFSGNLIFC